MTDVTFLTRAGKNILLYRGKTENGSLSTTQKLAASQFKVSVDTDTPSQSDTSIPQSIPIYNGVVNDTGANLFTGSSGGDNSTNNTTTYKEGAGVTDATAQNLIANATSATKTWTIANLASVGNNIDDTLAVGFWLYIKDSTALAKFLTSGTCLQARFGSDASNYYSITKTAADLDTGWNWINADLVSALTETGTVSGSINRFTIIITTNNSTDTFVAGDIIYDLLRQWTTANTIKDFASGYPVFDYVNSEATTRCSLTVAEANGFLVSKLGTYNEEATPVLESVALMTGDSKSSTDEFGYVIVDRII